MKPHFKCKHGLAFAFSFRVISSRKAIRFSDKDSNLESAIFQGEAPVTIGAFGSFNFSVFIKHTRDENKEWRQFED